MNHHNMPPSARRAIDRGGYFLSVLVTATLMVGAVVVTAWDVGAAGSESGSVPVQIAPSSVPDTQPASPVGLRSTPLTTPDTRTASE